MSDDRIGKLKRILENEPNDSFARYALGLEMAGKGETQVAVSIFQEVIHRDPAYIPAYQQLGYAYEKLGRRADAAETFRRGIEVAAQQNDLHARSEMQEALDELES